MPTTATFGNRSPASGATRVALDGLVSVDITPTSGLNPITTVTGTYNGFTRPVTLVDLGGGIKRATMRGAVRARVSNAVAWAAVTQDANSNPDSYSYTARNNYPPTPTSPDAVIRMAAYCPAMGDMLLRAGLSTGEAVDMAVRGLGIFSDTHEMTDMSVTEAGGGANNSTPAMTDMAVVEFESRHLIPISARTSEFHESRVPVNAIIQGTARKELVGVSALISGKATRVMIPISVEISTPAKFRLYALSALIGTFKESRVPISAEVKDQRAKMILELFVASQALQNVDLE